MVHDPEADYAAVMANRNYAGPVITWSEARKRGLRWYFTGEACPRGHIAKRSFSTRECRACVDFKKKQKALADLEAHRAKERIRYHRNGDKKRQSMRASRARHLDRRSSDDKARYKANPEPKRQYQRRYYRENREAIFVYVKQRKAHIVRATPPWLTKEQRALIDLHYKIAREMPGEWHVDHIIPLRGKNVCGLHVPWNLQIMPGDDNRRKQAGYEATWQSGRDGFANGAARLP